MASDEVVQFIQQYCLDNVFQITRSPGKNRKHDEWRDSWLDELGEVSAVRRSNETMRRIQGAVQNQFGAVNVLREEPVINIMAPENRSHAFDLFVPEDRTAIEICLSAIKNEFEKDVLKAMLDSRTTNLIILIRDYVTGRDETHYGLEFLEHPGPRSFIDLVKIYKLKIDPIRLCPE